MNADKNTPEAILKTMDRLLDDLISGAEKLLELSQQVIAEEEFVKLQEHQESLLGKLIAKDEALHALDNITDPRVKPLRLEIDRKIDRFQKLNADFVEKISAVHGLIHFDSAHVKKKIKK